MIPAEAVEAAAKALYFYLDEDHRGAPAPWESLADDDDAKIDAMDAAHIALEAAAPYMQQEVDLMRWKLNALSKWADAMIDESYYPQYGRDVKTILDVSSIEETKEDFGDD